MLNTILLGSLIFATSATAGVTVINPGQLVNDCYQEWQTRGWTIGEDRTPVDELAGFRQGIERICEVRSELFNEDPSVSPYIQQSFREIAPFILTASKQDIRAYILTVKESGRSSPRDPYLRP